MTHSIVTWNINSVRLRLPMVLDFLGKYQPDVLMLQEIKCTNDQFPRNAFIEAGYPHMAVHGQKGYHGVAILSRLPFEQILLKDYCGKTDCRHVGIVLGERAGLRDPVTLHNYYVPAGGDVPDPELNPKFAHKLGFLDELRACANLRPAPGERAIIVGDLNVAPLETDVWSHKQLLKVVSHTPAEVERFLRVQAAHDWIDVMRRHVPAEEKLFTWWSYRNRDWRASNRGRRLDHIWTTRALDGAATSMRVLDEARDWPRTSDHVPVIADFEID